MSELVDALATTPYLAEVFGDRSLVQAMLDVEVALGRALAERGLIPASAADAIGAAARVEDFDATALAADARRTGTPVIALVRLLTDLVRRIDVEAAGFVHWGATSQDISDTAFHLCLVRAHRRVAEDHEHVCAALVRLSDRHSSTIMPGRTLLQPAPPITFGLKAAGWHAALTRSWRRLDLARSEALTVQFGGAVGTLASLDPDGPAIADALADALQLARVDAPWHAHRDRIAALAAAHGVYLASLGKVARDVALLMQGEVAEAAEPGGSSSTMPHKRNPSGCAVVLAAAHRAPGLVASAIGSMNQEHERGVGGWHSEWPTIAAIVQATGSALAAMTVVVDGLQVDEARMAAHVSQSVLAERVMMRLGPIIGRDAAHALMTAAVERSREFGIALSSVLESDPVVASHLDAAELAQLFEAEGYLGAAETFRLRLLGRG